MTTVIPETPAATLDAEVGTLASNAEAWLRVPVADKVAMLREVVRRFAEVSADLVADAIAAKGVGAEFAGEEWVAGPISVIRTARFLADTMEAIDRTGRVPLPDRAISELPSGQVAVNVMPADRWDRVQYRGTQAQVRMHPEIPYRSARHGLGGIYTKPETAVPGVTVVLGAGNVASIGPLDLIHELYVEGRVAVLKFNPVNEYVGPYVERAFAHLADAGFVRFAYGGVAVGQHLIHHPQTDRVHITGSEKTYDTIVFGSGAEGADRKRRGERLFAKPVTAELGNVSPVIVVPGRWSERAMVYQARHVVTQLVQNAGFNCNAAKVMVLPDRWPQREEFVERVAQLLAARPTRPSYYPGTDERFDRVTAGASRVRTFGERRPGFVPPAIIEDLDPGDASPAFSEEAFCHVMATTNLPGDDAAAYLAGAVEFCNDRLHGTLNATILVDPATQRSIAADVERAVDRLQYGAVGVNLWAAAAFPLGVTPWGAYPGHPPTDIQSGTGFVHNARLVDRPEKSIVRAPFIQSPEPPWSVFHSRATTTLSRVAAFEADPGLRRLLPVLGPAMRP